MTAENEPPRKSSLASKALGVLEMALAGSFSAARYVRRATRLNILDAAKADRPDARQQAIRIDLGDEESVLGKAYISAKEKVVDAVKNDVEEMARLTAKKVPFVERVKMKNLHLTGGQMGKAGLVFASVGAISGYAVYKVADWLHGKGADDSPPR